MIILHWRHWKFFYSFTLILKQHHWEQMSPCPLHSGLHLLVPLLMSVLLLSTGLRIWPRSRATWKQGIAFNLNQFLDWGQPVKTGFKCIQRKREMGQRQAAGLHLLVGVLPHIGWMLLWNYGLPQEVCCGFSLWSHTERSWSQLMTVCSLGVQTIYTWVVLVGGDWIPKHILTADVPPPLFCIANLLVFSTRPKKQLWFSPAQRDGEYQKAHCPFLLWNHSR